MICDVLAIGAHPDDADLGVGGLLLNLAGQGLRTAILDLTRGELGSRGTPEERALEAAEAAKRLKVGSRVNAGLPDGAIQELDEQRLALIHFIRALRPHTVLAPMAPDRHPDHANAHALVTSSVFFAGVHRIDTGQEPFRPARIYYYHAYYDPQVAPALIIDVSGVFEEKVAALQAFKSQFYNPGYAGVDTHIASKAFWDNIRTRAAYWGQCVGAEYGEPLYTTERMGFRTLPEFLAPAPGGA
ncbi:MAG: bacillithiol biosynthesis deacetylase BshB1 [Candidatus Hydrogenedentes bacterium]|nr:bacillithiol biosynthesis deacetylase BshB1 [Candidatus Hydrogenedentota bacterium]